MVFSDPKLLYLNQINLFSILKYSNFVFEE